MTVNFQPNEACCYLGLRQSALHGSFSCHKQSVLPVWMALFFKLQVFFELALSFEVKTILSYTSFISVSLVIPRWLCFYLGQCRIFCAMVLALSLCFLGVPGNPASWTWEQKEDLKATSLHFSVKERLSVLRNWIRHVGNYLTPKKKKVHLVSQWYRDLSKAPGQLPSLAAALSKLKPWEGKCGGGGPCWGSALIWGVWLHPQGQTAGWW